MLQLAEENGSKTLGNSWWVPFSHICADSRVKTLGARLVHIPWDRGSSPARISREFAGICVTVMLRPHPSGISPFLFVPTFSVLCFWVEDLVNLVLRVASERGSSRTLTLVYFWETIIGSGKKSTSQSPRRRIQADLRSLGP